MICDILTGSTLSVHIFPLKASDQKIDKEKLMWPVVRSQRIVGLLVSLFPFYLLTVFL